MARNISAYSTNRHPARIPCGPTKMRRIPDGFSGGKTLGGRALDAGTGEGFTSSIAELPPEERPDMVKQRFTA